MASFATWFQCLLCITRCHTTSSRLKETSKLWRLLVGRGAGNRCTDVLPAVLFIKIFQGGLWICGLVSAKQNAKCTQTLCLLNVTIHLIASVLVAKHCLKSKNEPSNMFYWCLIYKALLWLRLFDFSQLTFRRNIFPQQNFLSMTDEKFSKNFCFNLRHLNVMSVWPFLQFGFSVCFVLLDVTTSSGLKETSKLWRLLVERDAGNRCTNVHCL